MVNNRSSTPRGQYGNLRYNPHKRNTMSRVIVFLYLVQFSRAFPMNFGHRGSNSEEGMPYGPFNHMNMQMPPVPPMYGLGLPHYSQMIQLQQALAQQPFPWLQQNAAVGQNNRGTSTPQQTPLNRPHHQPTYQYVTPQPQQPLQPLPAPDPQMPQMFPPLLGGMNPFQPYWQQGNYFGLFGFGNRPYNSEEANEDEEAAKPEKESPKAESPVTESSIATTADPNLTTLDPNQGGNATHNTSLVGEHSQIIRPDGQIVLTPPGNSILTNQGRRINTIAGPFRSSHPLYRSTYQQSISRNPQHKHYTVNKVLVGHGGRSNIVQHQEPLNKASSGKMLYTRGSQPTYMNAPTGRTDFLRSHVNAPRSFLQEAGINKPRSQALLPPTENNGRNLADPRKHDANSQVRQHSAWQVNKNRIANQRAIHVQPHQPHHNEHLTQYRSQPVNVDQKQNVPRGLFSNQQNTQNQNKGGDQKNNMYQNKANTISQGRQVLQKSDGFLRPSEILPYEGEDNVYEKDGRLYRRGNSWNNMQSNIETTRLHSGPQQETIYILSPISSSDVPGHPDNNPRQGSGNSINNAWEKATEHESPQYDSLGQRNVNIYPENGFYDQANSMPKQTWDNGAGLKISQSDPLDPAIDNHHTPIHQASQDLYIINDRAPAGERRYVYISNVEPTTQKEDSHIIGTRPLYQTKHTSTSPHKVATSFDHNSYFVGYDTDSQAQNKNVLHNSNTVFEKTDSERYNVGSDVPFDHGDSNHMRLSPYSEMNSWSYNTHDYLPSQTENTNYDVYPSGMRGQPAYQRQMETDYGGSRHYTCSFPISEIDQTRGHSNQLLYVCCKLSDVQSGTASGPIDNSNFFRLTLNEYNDWVPNQDRTHRQHTRNVIELPKVTYNQNTKTLLGYNNTNNKENTMLFAREDAEMFPCPTKGCHEQMLNHPYHGIDIVDSKPCSARGDLDTDPTASPNKKMMACENPDGPSINTQDDGLLHRRSENDVRPKLATGKLLRILACSKDRQIHTGNMLNGPGRGKPFSLKHDVPNAVAATVGSTITHVESYQPLESRKDPASNAQDCLILNK
uniref:Enamelin n=2 Tax=Leptobrachium leishanense TaxID=445787 RepID=A0A8C5MQ15_9ANUR